MRVHFSEEGWEDYRFWQSNDPEIFEKIDSLIEEIRRTPFKGTGKPEPLKGALTGWWSRRITREHRIVYRIEGKKGTDQRLEIIQLRYHY